MLYEVITGTTPYQGIHMLQQDIQHLVRLALEEDLGGTVDPQARNNVV